MKKPHTVKKETVLQEADRLINGARAQAYGDAKQNFKDIATGWATILSRRNGAEINIKPEDVAAMMMWLKICRNTNKPHRDNAVDIAGYASLMDTVTPFNVEL